MVLDLSTFKLGNVSHVPNQELFIQISIKGLFNSDVIYSFKTGSERANRGWKHEVVKRKVIINDMLENHYYFNENDFNDSAKQRFRNPRTVVLQRFFYIG